MPGRGLITVIHGPMFSGKTEELLRRIRRARVARKTCRLFKPTRDSRYSPDRVLPHSLAHSGHAADLGEAAESVRSARDILQHIARTPGVNLVGVEEAQFFDEELFDVIMKLSARGIHVVLSLLDQDFRRQPFPIPRPAQDGNEQGQQPEPSSNGLRNVGDYLAIAHESLKLTAVCVRCGREAQHSQKLIFARTDEAGQAEYLPASYYEEVVAVGTGRELSQLTGDGTEGSAHPRYVYEARCLECHEIPDEPLEGEAKDAPVEDAGEEVMLVDAEDPGALAKPSPGKSETPPSPASPEPKPVSARGDLPDLLELAD